MALSAPDLPEPSWRAALHLAFDCARGPTRLARSLHEGPLRVQRPFHPEENGTCHVYVLHPPGGVVGGDELVLRADVEANARALLTTPGATKLLRSSGATSNLLQSFAVGDGAVLEWLPPETIVFNGARAKIATRVELAPSATFAGWELMCLGRPACAELFAHGALGVETSIVRAGQAIYFERGELVPGSALLSAPWGLGGHVVFGTFVVAAPSLAEGAVTRVREALRPTPALAVTQLPHALVARYLGDSTLEARTLFEEVYNVVRPLYSGAAVPPRIWRT